MKQHREGVGDGVGNHRRRMRVGFAITVLYVGTFVVVLLWRWEEFRELPLNALGDFLAGGFAPLAFFWLVLGFHQQGEELRIQAEELRNSVDAQRRAVDEHRRSVEAQQRSAETQQGMLEVARAEQASNREKLEFERSRMLEEQGILKKQLQPVFSIDPFYWMGGAFPITYKVKVTNAGREARNVRIEAASGDLRISAAPVRHWATGAHFEYNLIVVEGKGGTLKIVYEDAIGNESSTRFQVSVNGAAAAPDIVALPS